MWLELVLLGIETPGEEDWTGQTQVVEQCLSELKKIRNAQAGNGKSMDGLNRAMLNLRAMAIAMKQRDRVMVVDTAKAACAALSREAGTRRKLRRV
jgi:hypothetical protein